MFRASAICEPILLRTWRNRLDSDCRTSKRSRSKPSIVRDSAAVVLTRDLRGSSVGASPSFWKRGRSARLMPDFSPFETEAGLAESASVRSTSARMALRQTAGERQGGVYHPHQRQCTTNQRVRRKKLKSSTSSGHRSPTFRYDLTRYSPKDPYGSIQTHCGCGRGFRAAYSEPTMFKEMANRAAQGGSGSGSTLDLAALKSAVKANPAGVLWRFPSRT